MIHQLAEAAAKAEAFDWKFWLEVVVVPCILLLLTQILRRQRDAERLAAKQSEKLTVLGTKMERVEKDVGEIKDEVKDTVDETQTIVVEGNGSLAQFKIEVEKRFVTKDDFRRFCEDNTQQNQTILNAIRHLELKKS